MKRVCIITDNDFLFMEFNNIIREQTLDRDYKFDFFYTEGNKTFEEKYSMSAQLKPVNLKKVDPEVWENYDVFLSLHSRQLFPNALVNGYRCINVHPGYSPYNRGVYPQAFCILNKKPAGVTIHEIDAEVDHGPIIYREHVTIEDSDTTSDVLQRIRKKEVELLNLHIRELLDGTYEIQTVDNLIGNINYKKDFNELCEIDLNRQATYGEVIDFLRAMTCDGYDNAYFIDKNGEKVYVKIELKKSKE